MTKISWRDGFFLFGGILIGLGLAYLYVEISLITIINNILPHINIQAVNFNINETELVKAMNSTFGGMR